MIQEKGRKENEETREKHIFTQDNDSNMILSSSCSENEVQGTKVSVEAEIHTISRGDKNTKYNKVIRESSDNSYDKKGIEESSDSDSSHGDD